MQAQDAALETWINGFATQMARRDVVQSIVLVDDEDGLTLWTVVEASPLDRAAVAPVYELEAALLRTAPRAVDLRIVNLGDLSVSVNEWVPDGRVLFSRAAGAAAMAQACACQHGKRISARPNTMRPAAIRARPPHAPQP